MLEEKKNFFSKKTIIISLVVLIVFGLSLVYFYFVYSSGGLNIPDNSFSDLGDAIGVIGLISLIWVYSRTLLKITVQKGTLSKRLEPLELRGIKVESFMKKTLRVSNVFHPYLGGIAVIAILFHCFLTSSFMNNWLLRAALILIVWQGFFGLLLKFRFVPVFLRKNSYLVHAQFFTGILLLILAGLGHLLLRG
jgi:hypothetical protein